MCPLFRRFAQATRGNVLIEFAFCVPILASLFIAGVEATRYVVLNQKLERTTATLGDLTTQARALAEGDMTGIFSAGDHVMAPFAVSTEGRMILSSIVRDGAVARIAWQRSFGAGTTPSRVGLEGEPAELPTGLVVREDENLIVSEVTFDYAPMLVGPFFAGRELYAQAFFRPRFANLSALQP